MTRPRSHDYTQVAALACEAIERNVPCAPFVALHLGVNNKTASQIIVRARAAGHDIPLGRRAPQARPTRTPLALRCTDCTTTYSLDRAEALIRHTLTEHGRQPSTIERTPS
jgi:hypothetical protein